MEWEKFNDTREKKRKNGIKRGRKKEGKEVYRRKKSRPKIRKDMSDSYHNIGLNPSSQLFRANYVQSGTHGDHAYERMAKQHQVHMFSTRGQAQPVTSFLQPQVNTQLLLMMQDQFDRDRASAAVAEASRTRLMQACLFQSGFVNF